MRPVRFSAKDLNIKWVLVTIVALILIAGVVVMVSRSSASSALSLHKPLFTLESNYTTEDAHVIPYQVIEIPHVFTKDECRFVMNSMEGKLERSMVVGVGENDVSKDRTSMTGWIKPTDPVLGGFAKKLMSLGSVLTGIRDPSRYEDVSIVRYEKNQFYKEHFDACTTKTYCGDALRIYRTATIIMYLNDEFEGGETSFPRIGVKVRPEMGKIAFFYNTDDSGKEIPDSLHAGLPVQSGVKWICTLWIKFFPSDAQVQELNTK